MPTFDPAAATARRPSLAPAPLPRRAVAWGLLGVLVLLAAGAGLLGASMAPGPPPARLPGLAGVVRAPGGPFLVDRYGRVVLLHGVNVVYKRRPFEAFPDPGKPWNFSVADARRISKLGFDVVRLGMLWQGLEPGTAESNDPSICRRGRPGDPHQFSAAVMDRYLRRLAETVDLLGRFGIYTILDMHQDVYSQRFDGEGAPTWAVCTDGVKSTDPPGRWSRNYGTRAAGIAYRHFWRNNVVGDLQGQFDMVWGHVARYFAHNPWVLGYDPYNEPFSRSILRVGSAYFDAELECFYTGSAHVGGTLHGAPPIHCPPYDPRTGVIPTILRNDPRHLIFFEPDNFAARGYPTYLGPMDFPNLVYNVHVYCPQRNPVTGDPTTVHACASHDAVSLARRELDRPMMASRAQPGGPAWFVTEFGATDAKTLLARETAEFDAALVGWTYWSWKYYADPTGSRDEALVTDTGRLRPSARTLAQVYAEAVAGVPRRMSFDTATGRFVLVYRARPLGAPTLVVVPTTARYPQGYCATARDATIVSTRDARLLEIRNDPRAGERRDTVTVTVTTGPCRRGPRE